MNTFAETTKQLMKDLDIKNIHAVPRITKVVVSVGVGKHREVKGHTEAVIKDLAAITGQRPQPRQVTLRGKRMEDFVTRFVSVTLPRVRDFRGLSATAIDAQGNLSVGLAEHLAFPEIHPDKTDVIFGVQSTFVTSAKNEEEATALFKALGFPFKSTEQMKEEELRLETAADKAAKARQRLAAQKAAPVAE
jgi:large subunit ribosomal protein L5